MPKDQQKDQQRETGWFARWRQRRREKALRADDISRRVDEGKRRERERGLKQGLGGGPG